MTSIKRIIPAVQQYPWGKKGKESAVARLLPEFCPNSRYAELWIGSHPSASALVDNPAGQSLRELIAAEPRVCLGDMVRGRFGELPFLLKILSIGEPLSIQAHPDRARAENLHRTFPQHYPDPNHKPEMGVALTTVHLLFGLKERQLIVDTFARYPMLLGLVSHDLIPELQGASNFLSDSALQRATYRSLITAPSSERIGAVHNICNTLLNTPPTSYFEERIPQLVEMYGPEDIGILSGLLLNEVVLSPRQAIFIAPGIPHSYLSGDLIECMAASDNVVRAGLTRKYQDTETLLDMLDYGATTKEVIEAIAAPESPQTLNYETPTAEFSLSIIHRANQSLTYQKGDKPEMLFLLEGAAVITTNNEHSISLRAGEGAFVPAAVNTYKLAANSCSFVRVTVPDSSVSAK